MERQMQDPAFQVEHDKTRTEFEITRALIAARVSQNLTQKELSARTGIRQSNISRIENGTCSPTIATLQALADGMGKKLNVKFE
jgi:transcriptional regulator with XRE-family HTH domain